jgi:plastocyanin
MKSSPKTGWSLLLAATFWLLLANAQAASGVSVEISKFAFAPKEITVAPGTHVTWSNSDELPHTVNATDKSFNSKAMDTGDSYDHTFDQPGDYAYFCAVHPFMTGIVHVRSP